MKQFTEDQIAQAYAYYGVQLSGVDPVQTGPLEDVILAVIESPPPGRFISTLPALIAKNADKINFSYLLKQVEDSAEASAKLGFILDVTGANARELDLKQIAAALEKTVQKLKEAERPLVWLAPELRDFFDPDDLNPKWDYERKWGVRPKLEPEDFKRHMQEYLRNE